MRDIITEMKICDNKGRLSNLKSLRRIVEHSTQAKFKDLNTFAHSVYLDSIQEDADRIKKGQQTVFESLEDEKKEKIYVQWAENMVEEAEREPDVMSFSNEEEKREYLKEHGIFDHKFDETVDCIHCEQTVKVADFNVVDGYICCSNYPECDGTIIDWFPGGSMKEQWEGKEE